MRKKTQPCLFDVYLMYMCRKEETPGEGGFFLRKNIQTIIYDHISRKCHQQIKEESRLSTWPVDQHEINPRKKSSCLERGIKILGTGVPRCKKPGNARNRDKTQNQVVRDITSNQKSQKCCTDRWIPHRKIRKSDSIHNHHQKKIRNKKRGYHNACA